MPSGQSAGCGQSREAVHGGGSARINSCAAEADESVGSRIRVIPGTEGNGLILRGHEPLVGDRYPVGVMAQITEDVPGPTEGRLGVDDPFDTSEFSGEPVEGRWISPVGDVAREGEFPLLEGLL